MHDGMDKNEPGTSFSEPVAHCSSKPPPKIIPYNPRASRNLAEKQRRDNLNTNISTMAALVPAVAASSRRMDKISILRLAAAFLRTQYTLGHSSNYFPPQLKDFDLEQYFVDHVVGSGGFFLVVTTRGKIIYVSRQVEQHLGHVQNELLGQSLYNFVYPGDYKTLTDNLTPDGMQPMYPSLIAQTRSELNLDSGSSSSEDSTSQKINEKPKSFCEQRRNFQIRLSQRTISKREQPQYERFDISGVLRLAEACKNVDSKGKHRESTSNDIVFAGLVTLPRKRSITELSILDATKDEYVTRHLLDGHIIYCDHRVSVVAGYMSEEVTGANAFKFMHKDDSKWTILGLRQMYDRSEPFGSSCYRLLTKTGCYIYLRTHGYLEYDKDTQKMISFVCINTLVSEKEGIKLMSEMKGRFYSASDEANKLFLEDTEQPTSLVEALNANSQSSSRSDIEDSTLEGYISFLIKNIDSSMADDQYSQSPYAEVAALSLRISPAIAQGSIGSDESTQYKCYFQDKKHRRQLKEECKRLKRASEDLVPGLSPSDARQNPMSDMEDVKPQMSETLISDDVVVHRSRHVQNATCVQSTMVVMRKSGTKPRRSQSYTAPLDAQNANVPDVHQPVTYVNASMFVPGILHNGIGDNIKIRPGRFIVDQQSSVPYLRNGDGNGDGNGDAITAGGMKTHEQWPLKRICSEEDLLPMHIKRRTDDVAYTSTSTSQAPQDYGSSLPENEYPQEFWTEFNNHGTGTKGTSSSSSIGTIDTNPTNVEQLTMTESEHGLSLPETDDYRQLMESSTISLEVANPEGLLDVTLRENFLMNPDFPDVPNMEEILQGMFDVEMDLDDNAKKANVDELTPGDQAVNDNIRRTHHQLENSMKLRESQLNKLMRDLENPALSSAHRRNLSKLKAAHNFCKQMFKTLRQDYDNIQMNVKQNVGV